MPHRYSVAGNKKAAIIFLMAAEKLMFEKQGLPSKEVSL
jgi:hypothetical protein